ncbi:MAG: hypothetical protein QNI99_04870 [Woeseiaceae bacterium]|nr:hypothetical protein [Woeseiaceae bacterium]
MRLRFLVLSTLLFFTSAALATAQRPDRIVYDGQTYALQTNPLNQYFQANPDRHPFEAGDKDRMVTSTALWRGYVATFALENDLLVLRDFEVLQSTGDPKDFDAELVSQIDQYFATPDSRVLDWYSGIMVIPQGEMVHYVHMGYSSVYESYLMLRIENGRIKEIATFNADEFLDFKRRQFAVFRESDEYRKLVEYYSEDGDYDEEFMNQFIFDGVNFVETVMISFDESRRQTDRTE